MIVLQECRVRLRACRRSARALLVRSCSRLPRRPLVCSVSRVVAPVSARTSASSTVSACMRLICHIHMR